jgi:ubiquitin C-terminal hydrolase
MVVSTRRSPLNMPKPRKVLYSKDNIKFGWSKISKDWKTGRGFENLGNSCYLNATVQALFHIPSFVNWLLSDEKHRKKGACTGEKINQKSNESQSFATKCLSNRSFEQV